MGWKGHLERVGFRSLRYQPPPAPCHKWLVKIKHLLYLSLFFLSEDSSAYCSTCRLFQGNLWWYHTEVVLRSQNTSPKVKANHWRRKRCRLDVGEAGREAEFGRGQENRKDVWGGGVSGRERNLEFLGKFCLCYTVFKPLLCLRELFSGDKHLLIIAFRVIFSFFPIFAYKMMRPSRLFISVQITIRLLLPVSTYFFLMVVPLEVGKMIQKFLFKFILLVPLF